MKVLPVILITGFLGAGKTTFLNEMLSFFKLENKKAALLINEFGKINIDKELIVAKGQVIYEVNQGSIFCVCTRDQFINALNSIADEKNNYDLVIIESTGLANTADLSGYFCTPLLAGRIDVRQNFCLIDALNFHKVYHTLPAVKTQVQEASLLVINKTDLVSKEYLLTLTEKLKEINERSIILETSYGKADFRNLIDLSTSYSTEAILNTAPPADIFSVTLVSKELMNLNKIKIFLHSHQSNLLRAKGFIRTADTSLYVEWIGERLFIKPMEEELTGNSRLVLIGYQLNQEALTKEFRHCIH